MTRTVNIMVGISGAGKSTWIKKTSAAKHIVGNYVTICPDNERKKISGDISNQECSAEAFQNCFYQLSKAVDDENIQTIYWDATNLNIKSLNNIMKIVRGSVNKWSVNVICLEDSRNWKLCYDRVESDIKNGVDRSKSNVVSETTGQPIIKDMSDRYVHLVDEFLSDWCKRNNVRLHKVYG